MSSSNLAIEMLHYDGKDYLKLGCQMKELLKQVDDEETRLKLMESALADPMKWWTPNGKQEELINKAAEMMGRSRTPTVLFSAANGIGKTTVVVMLLANIVFGPQNGWFLKKHFFNWPNPKMVWYVTTKTGLTDTIMPEIERIFPPGTYKTDKMGAAFVRAIHFENGWELRFFTMDVDEQQMESANVGLVVIDEPAPQFIWNAVKSRVRMGALTLLPMTPLNVEPYIIDEIAKTNNPDLYAQITASVYDACEERGIRGHLEAQIIDEMVEKYPPDEREARVYGKFMYFSERIWVNLDAERHYVDPEDYPVDLDEDYIVHTVDPHDSRPTASVYGAIQLVKHSDEYKEKIKNGEATQQFRRIVFDETPEFTGEPYWELRRTMILEDEPQMWADLEDALGIKVVNKRVIDKRFGFQTRLSSNIARVYAQAGRELDQRFHANKRFVYVPSYEVRSVDKNKGKGNEITYGHNLVMSAMEDLEDGKPGLVIWKTCRHTINGMNNYVRQRASGRTGLEIAAGETKIIEKYKDFNDLLRYFTAVVPGDEYIDNKRAKSSREAAERRIGIMNTAKRSRNFYSTIGSHMRRVR